VVFDGRPDNLHWNRGHRPARTHQPEPREPLAAELEGRITAEDRAEWVKGSVEDWVLEGHRLAQAVAYGDLGTGDPAAITAEYERQAGPVIELQLEKAGVRLAYLLNAALQALGFVTPVSHQGSKLM